MPKYFCEYCGIYLTNSSPRSRKQHAHGRKHINNKIEYYSQFLYEYQSQAYSKNLKLIKENLMNVASKMTTINQNQSSTEVKYKNSLNFNRHPIFQSTVLPGQNIRVHPIQPQNLLASQVPNTVINFQPLQ